MGRGQNWQEGAKGFVSSFDQDQEFGLGLPRSGGIADQEQGNRRYSEHAVSDVFVSVLIIVHCTFLSLSSLF